MDTASGLGTDDTVGETESPVRAETTHREQRSTAIDRGADGVTGSLHPVPRLALPEGYSLSVSQGRWELRQRELVLIYAGL